MEASIREGYKLTDPDGIMGNYAKRSERGRRDSGSNPPRGFLAFALVMQVIH